MEQNNKTKTDLNPTTNPNPNRNPKKLQNWKATEYGTGTLIYYI